ncbi:MAG: tripartite tricarboxylate transporter permease [Candidatus Limnocylindria bacterium]
MEFFGTAFANLGGGFATAFEPFNLAMIALGVVLGLVIGILPGLGATSGVAILLPVTVVIADASPTGSTSAVMLLAGIYWGALFGGVITSILFNIPGEPWAVALLFDGFPLAKRRGRPGLALTSAFVASLIGAMIAVILFTLFAEPLARFALRFGPPELFAVFVMAFATLVGFESANPLKALMMIAFGLLLASVGFDSLTGQPRLAFGQIGLLSGIGFIPVAIGLFGIGEILASAEESGAKFMQDISAKLGLKDLKEALGHLRRRARMIIANSLIGFWIGVLPGTGATPASFLAYGIARQYSSEKVKANFGRGEVGGVMAPQAAADAAGVGALLPMVALGVPGSPTAAVILAGLYVWGLQPGPLLFVEQSDFVWGLIASIYLAHTLAFTLCMLAVPLFAMIMRAPYAILTPFIIIISTIGAYSINNSMLDVFITVIFGVIGYWLRKMKYPLAPLVVALVLGGATERALRQSLIAGQEGGIAIFVSTPLSTTLFILAFAVIMLPVIQTILRRRRPKPATPPGVEADDLIE